MGSGRVPPSSLDSLMLAYTDLSAPAKGTGFKVHIMDYLVELVNISLLGPSRKRHKARGTPSSISAQQQSKGLE